MEALYDKDRDVDGGSLCDKARDLYGGSLRYKALVVDCLNRSRILQPLVWLMAVLERCYEHVVRHACVTSEVVM